MNIRIAIVAPEQIPVPGSGSVEICVLAIARKLALRHNVTIISRTAPGRPRVSRLGNKLTIVRVPTGSSSKYIHSVLSYLRGKRFDLIQVDNRPHYMAKIKQAHPGTPVSLFLHSLTFVPRTRSVSASMSRADVIIANSNSLKHNLRSMFPRHSRKIRTVHLGVDLSRFAPPSSAEKKRLQRKYNVTGSYNVLFVGRVIPRKGVPVLIKAVAAARRLLPQTKLIVAGKGKSGYIARLRSQAKERGVPAAFLGKISHSRIHQIYRLADCFVCPSQKHEAFGLVNVEAMASGVPVVASNIGGINEIVKHGHNGYLIAKFRDAASFARYIIKLGSSKSARRRLGRAGRKAAMNKFSWGGTAARLASLYQAQVKR